MHRYPPPRFVTSVANLQETDERQDTRLSMNCLNCGVAWAPPLRNESSSIGSDNCQAGKLMMTAIMDQSNNRRSLYRWYEEWISRAGVCRSNDELNKDGITSIEGNRW
ncbi:MAG: hypothetical protein QOG23_483 [Blastocatellia bacterium]|jgi:hypothetical protein|nr:hypothetical protein [Blastocatellia bacterium]